MKTNLSENNPFGYSRYGYLFEKIKDNKSNMHLDFGAGDGKIIKKLVECGILQYGLGVDISKSTEYLDNDNIMIAKVSDLSLFSKNHIKKFDSISMLDVLEHIYDQNSVLYQLGKMLKDNGIIIITVPRKHIFSFLDTGNYKFIFPALHKKFIVYTKGRDYYFSKYEDPDNPLFGDVEKSKMWHQHFSINEIHELLLNNGFKIIDVDGSGLFNRILSIIKYIMPRCCNKIFDIIINFDNKLFSSSNLFVTARYIK